MYDNDFESMAQDYVYDKIGQLVSDQAHEINSIKWDVYHKITEITFNNPSNQSKPQTIQFSYDAMGNRISKRVYYPFNGNFQKKSQTYYIRDAQGNTLSTYNYVENAQVNASGTKLGKLSQGEVHLFGSERMGMARVNRELLSWENPTADHELANLPQQLLATGNTTFHDRKVGSKFYELKDHRSNVYAVITDRKWATLKSSYVVQPPPANCGFCLSPVVFAYKVVGYEPVVVSLDEYYPFGSQMPGRGYAGASYRYGFQGQEKDDEIYGEGNAISYKYRISDSRIGRFLSIDPLAPDYPWNSPYAFSENRVVDGVELEGLEFSKMYIHNYSKTEAKKQIHVQVAEEMVILWKFIWSDNGMSKTEKALQIGHDALPQNRAFL